MIGSVNATSNAWKADYWDRLESLGSETGLNFSDSIDDIERDNNTSALASMEKRETPYGQENILHISNRFDYLNPELQSHVLSHEGIHALDFDDRLVPELKASRGISEDTAYRISMLKDQGRDEKEGVTQAINKRINPDPNSHYFYPGETSRMESLLEDGDGNLNSELLEEMNDLEEQVIDNHREINTQLTGEGVYIEYGSFNDADYSVMVLGEGAESYGEKLAGEYLGQEDIDLQDMDYEDFVEADLEKYNLE